MAESSKRWLGMFFLQLSIMILSIAGIFAKKASTVDFLSNKFLIYYSVELFFIVLYAILWQQVLKKK